MLTFVVLLLGIPLVVVVAGWAWRYQMRWLALIEDAPAATGSRAQVVRITSVVAIDDSVLVAVMEAYAAPGPDGPAGALPERHLVGQLPGPDDDALPALRDWTSTGVALVMRSSAHHIRFEARTGAPVTLTTLAAAS